MIIKFKIYEKKATPEYYSFYEDFKSILDVNHYINILKTKNITEYEEDRLLYFACRELPELSVKLVDYIPTKTFSKNNSAVAELPYNYFKSILKNDNIYNALINNSEFFSNLVYHNSDVKNFKLLKDLGATFNQDLLMTACFKGSLDIVKFLISTGLDPNKKKDATFSRAPENCMDYATKYNDKSNVIKYLVDLGVPVTYRHIYNVIQKGNLDAVPYLVNSKNLVKDYSFSSYATQSQDKYQYTLSSLVSLMLNNNLNKYVKILLNKEKDKGYDILQGLPFEYYDNYKIINTKYLELAYSIISNYDGKYENSFTTEFITNYNEKFWLNKMKRNPSIISKLRNMDISILKLYDYQKIILEDDIDNLKYIKNILNPKIEKEFDYLINTSKFNI